MRPDAAAPLDVSMNPEGVAPSSKAFTATAKSRRIKNASSASDDNTNVGNVLRSVYQNAVKEDIPAEMLDLLSKLD